jgi:chaperonin GroES
MKNKTITPLHDRVVIRPSEQDGVSRGGIIIPDTAKEKPIKGVVVACGNGSGSDSPMTVKVGDVVLYGRYSGNEIDLNEEKCLIMRESDILAILHNK